MEERPDFPDDVEYSLAFLRKGEGFTRRRLERTSVVDKLLRKTPADEFGRLRSRLTSAIQSLDDAEAALLLDVFGLSAEAAGLPRLQDRRLVHADKIGRGIETVADREMPAVRRLTSKLITGAYAQSPLVLDVPEMHNGIIYESTSTLVIVENRRWKETREHYRFAATFEEMDFVRLTRSYPAKAAVWPGSRFELRTEPTSKGYNDEFHHLDGSAGEPEPMRRGQAYDLKFTLKPDGFEDRRLIVNASRAFHERSLLASIHVAFVGPRPDVLWRFERVSYFDSPGEPSERNHVELDEHGIAALRLRDVHGGLFSGIGWRW